MRVKIGEWVICIFLFGVSFLFLALSRHILLVVLGKREPVEGWDAAVAVKPKKSNENLEILGMLLYAAWLWLRDVVLWPGRVVGSMASRVFVAAAAAKSKASRPLAAMEHGQQKKRMGGRFSPPKLN